MDAEVATVLGLISALLIYSAGAKFVAPELAAVAMANFGLTSSTNPLAARTVALVELGVGIGLLEPDRRVSVAALGAACALFAGFATVQGRIMGSCTKPSEASCT